MKTKPFNISKWNVLRAFELVKANAGVAGVDEQSIKDFNARRKAIFTPYGIGCRQAVISLRQSKR